MKNYIFILLISLLAILKVNEVTAQMDSISVSIYEEGEVTSPLG